MDREPDRSIAAMAAVIREESAAAEVRADFAGWLRGMNQGNGGR